MSGSQRSIPRWLAVTLLVLASARIAVELMPGLADAGSPKDAIEWLPHEEALAESARTGKPLLLDFTADWCGPCTRMKEETWPDDQVAALVARHFVPTRLVNSNDPRKATSGEADVRAQFGVQGFPTTIVLLPLPRGPVRRSGFVAPEEMRRFLESAALQHLAALNAQRRISAPQPSTSR